VGIDTRKAGKGGRSILTTNELGAMIPANQTFRFYIGFEWYKVYRPVGQDRILIEAEDRFYMTELQWKQAYCSRSEGYHARNLSGHFELRGDRIVYIDEEGVTYEPDVKTTKPKGLKSEEEFMGPERRELVHVGVTRWECSCGYESRSFQDIERHAVTEHR